MMHLVLLVVMAIFPAHPDTIEYDVQTIQTPDGCGAVKVIAPPGAQLFGFRCIEIDLLPVA